MIEIVGTVAILLSVGIFVPQIYKAYTTKSTQDLSYGLLFLYVAAHTTWIIYGIMLPAYAVVIADTTTVICALYIIYLKTKYG